MLYNSLKAYFLLVFNEDFDLGSQSFFKVINKLNRIYITIALSFSFFGDVGADDFDLFPSDNNDSGDNSFYKEDGSLVNVYGAEKAGIAIKDGEQEYFVIPKDDGSPTFIYDDELIICTNTGCY